MKCIYCSYHKTYALRDTQRKCAHCKRKFSPKKHETEQRIIECFVEGLNASAAANLLEMHFISVKKRYDQFRQEIIAYEEEQYQNNAHLVNEYDEYLYLPKSLKVFEKNMHKVQNFLTLAYGARVYTIMMPKIESYDYDLTAEIENKKLYKFLRFNKVAKLNTIQNSITNFWDFFETYITKYKGIRPEQFVYYLKEIEFRFNFTYKEQQEILLQCYRDNLSV